MSDGLVDRLAERCDYLQAENAALRRQVETLRDALTYFCKRRQFNELCFCDTCDGAYCVGQKRCRVASAALAAIPAPPTQEA